MALKTEESARNLQLAYLKRIEEHQETELFQRMKHPSLGVKDAGFAWIWGMEKNIESGVGGRLSLRSTDRRLLKWTAMQRPPKLHRTSWVPGPELR